MLPAGFDLSLFGSNGLRPASSLGQLIGPDPTTGGIYTFAGSGILLAPSAYYFVVATGNTPSSQGSFGWSMTNPSATVSGWAIPNVEHVQIHRWYELELCRPTGCLSAGDRSDGGARADCPDAGRIGSGYFDLMAPKKRSSLPIRNATRILMLFLGVLLPMMARSQGTLYVSNLDQTPTRSRAIGSDSWIARTFYMFTSDPNACA